MAARFTYESELAELVASMIKMGAMSSGAIGKAMQAFKTGDKTLCEEVIQGDAAIDEKERTIEQKCLTLILRQQPVAGDLRKITAAMKMVTDIGRIGDAAVDIAEISRNIDHEGMPPVMDQIETMAAVAQKMVVGAINAYVSSSLSMSKEVMAEDDVVDGLFDYIKMDLVRLLAQKPELAEQAIDYLMVIKYLERLSDHAVNICEWVEFTQTGKHRSVQIL